MQTQFNKEIYDFKENFWKGLTKRQAVWGGIALGAGLLIMIYVGFYLKQDWGQIVGAAVALICGFIGFFTMDGMPGEMVFFLIYRRIKTPRSSFLKTIRICRSCTTEAVITKITITRLLKTQRNRLIPSRNQSLAQKISIHNEEACYARTIR